MEWHDFESTDGVTAFCDISEYEYKKYDRMYAVRQKGMRWYWLIKARTPGEALSRCLAGRFADLQEGLG